MVSVASLADLLRLAVVPVFAWAAYRDVRTRRLPNRLWPPLVAVGGLALAIDAAARYPFAGVDGRLFLIRVAFSVAFLVPFSYVAFRLGAFGGADAKAVMTLAVCLPTTPTYSLPGQTMLLPVEPGALGVAAMSALTNAVLVAAGYVVVLGAANLAVGRIELASFLGRPIGVERLPTAHGTLLDRGGLPSSGLDLDALRMYLRWRGLSLAELRSHPARYRDPASVGETFEPTDGAVGADGGVAANDGETASDGGVANEGEAASDGMTANDGGAMSGDEAGERAGLSGETDAVTEADDPWAAAAFLEAIDGTAYGTRPEELRDGLDRVADAEDVWVSPGLPFVVPLFGGLVIALTVGDVLTMLLVAVGLY